MKDEITPIEILKATPKNNCGECGFNTCMAFATSLVRRTTNVEKCPYINIDEDLKKKIEIHFSNDKIERKPGMHALSNLEEKILKLNLKLVSDKLKLNYESKDNKEIILIKYLDTVVKLIRDNNKLEILKENNEPFDIYDKILVYNYIYFSGDKGLSGEWVGMEGLPNSISKIKALKKGAEEPIAEYFKGKLNLLKERVARFPHEFLSQDKCIADLCFIVYIFPMLPIRVNFSDESKEDGFEAGAKFLYDKNVISYLDLESLVFASEKLTEKLIDE
jgi:hypothetical protein